MFVYEQINSACPYAMPEELEYLRQEAFKLGPDNQIVMIGCGPGVMSVAMLEGHPKPPKMAIIDLTSFYYCEAHMRGAGIDPNKVWFITGDSSSVGRMWTNPVDLLIIDGDHGFAGVYKDIQAWWPHANPGGIIFFHDYLARDGGFNGSGDWKPSEVRMAVEQCRDSTWQLIKQIGISVVYMKV